MVIPYTKPSITDLEVDAATFAARNGWGKDCYEYIERFETMFARHIGSKYAVATSSCTGALHLGLAALGIGKGDEVILADTNWIATAAPIVYLGAKPVFVDIDPVNWTISPLKAEEAITKRTKAIIATHLYGNLCWLGFLFALSDKYGIPIIEDSAEAIGSVYHGKRAGSLGKFGVFSFHGSKTMTTGEGGMLVTNDKNLYEKVLQLNNHGRSPRDRQFRPSVLGFKYKISNVQAAIGCAQVDRIDELIQRKRDIFFNYSHLLLGTDIQMNYEANKSINGFWMPTVVTRRANTRPRFLAAFKKAGIDARVFFYPLSSLPMFKGTNPKRITSPFSHSICKRAFNLPSFHDITYGEQAKITNIVREINK